MKKVLNKKTFLENEVLKQYIETLDNIDVKYISRQEYIFLWWKIIDNWKMYLPDDINQNDYLEILSQIYNYYQLSPVNFNSVQDKTKVLTAILLKVKNEEVSSLHDVNFWVVKKLLKEVKKITQKSLKDFDQKDIDFVSLQLSNYLNLEFFKWLYEIWNKNLKDNLKVFTKEDKIKVEKRKAKNISWDYIRFKGTHQYYDFDQTLREYIWLEDIQLQLQTLRIEGDEEKIASYELQVVQEIFKMINIFPYHLNKDANGYNPTEIVKTKEIYCVGFALILHSLLDDLWISHQWIDVLQHVATKINIWGKSYIFDNVMCDKVEIYKPSRTGGKYDYIENIREYGTVWNIEEILISKILHNNASKLAESWKNEEAIASLQAALNIHYSFDSLLNISKIYKKVWKNEEALQVLHVIMNEFWFLTPELKDILYDDLWDVYYSMWDYKNAIKNYKLIDSSLKQWLCSRIWDTYFHLWEYQKALFEYNEEIRINKNESTLRKTRLKIYVLKKILKIGTLFDFRYKTEKRMIDEKLWDENILDFVNQL